MSHIMIFHKIMGLFHDHDDASCFAIALIGRFLWTDTASNRLHHYATGTASTEVWILPHGNIQGNLERYAYDRPGIGLTETLFVNIFISAFKKISVRSAQSHSYLTGLITTEIIFKSSPPSAAYASVNQADIGSDNGLSPIRRQAII